MYESMGFTPDGRIVEGEIVYKLGEYCCNIEIRLTLKSKSNVLNDISINISIREWE